MYFQYLIHTVSLLSINNINRSLEIGDQVKNIEMLQNN